MSSILILSDLDRLVLRYEGLHDAPGDEVGETAEAEDDEVAGRLALKSEEGERGALVLRIGEQVAGGLLDEHRAHAARHGTDAGDGGDGALREHVADGGEEVGAPGLVSGRGKADQDGRQPGRVETDAERLGHQRAEREEGEDEHRQHTSRIGIHSFLVDENLGQVAASDGDHRHDGVEREDQRLAEEGGRRGVELVAEVGRSPEQEEPPYAVGEEFADDEGPGLLVLEALEHRDGLLCGEGGLFGSLGGIILVDVFQLGLVDVLRFLGLVVHKLPEEHPEEAQSTDDDKRPFPAERLGERRDAERGGEGADGGTCVEDGGGEGAVLLGIIFRRHLDGGGEVARLAEREDAPAEEEQPDGRGGYGQGGIGADLDGAHRGDGADAREGGGGPAAGGV